MKIGSEQKKEILLATRNKGKVREFREALKGLEVQIRSLTDFPNPPEIEEDGRTFAENALKKARFYSKLYGRITLSDDSGLEVDVLKGAPGVYSARYSGKGASDSTNNQKLLKELERVSLSRREARFKCSIAIVSPDAREAIVEGACKGRIGFKEVGKRGFGYDPLFILPQYGKTMAQLTLSEKNRISHRGKALRKLRKIMKNFLQ